jgi:DNA-binding transcriptional LysR family regulator
MEFRQIRYALSVAKERSFTRASTRLNISQSAVSAQIRLLENEIGFSLFWRSTRGVELTEAGRTFLHDAERIVGDLLNLSETARRLRGGGSETLNLGMVSGAAQTFVPRFFRNLSKTIQDIKLRLIITPTRNIFKDLQEERIDAGIAIESHPDGVPAGLVFDRLATIEMALIVHPKHALAKSKKPINVSAIAAEPIVMNELEVGYGQIVLSLFSDLGIRPNILAIADNVETIKVIVQSGAGIAILPRTCVDQEISFRLLKALRLVPERNVAFSLFRRRESLSRQKEACLSALNRALRFEETRNNKRPL